MRTRNIEYQPARPDQADAIVELYARSGGEAEVGQVACSLTDYPAFVACDGIAVAGFVYGRSFAPDVIELDNIHVQAELRNRGIGSVLLNHFECGAIEEGYGGIIAINSDLYPYGPGKRRATRFYERHGYSEAFSTGPTQLFTKMLGQSV